MHEYPITQHIINIASEYAAKYGGNEVRVIHLVVGDDSGYVSSSIDLYFEIIAKGSLCERAKLDIERVTPRLKCSHCGELFIRKPFSFACPLCGGEGNPTEIGKEFYIKSIEVEGT